MRLVVASATLLVVLHLALALVVVDAADASSSSSSSARSPRVATSAACALETLAPRRGNERSSSSSSSSSSAAALLRVTPWLGCGAQLTIGVGWDAILPLDDDDDDDDDAREARAATAAAPSSLSDAAPPPSPSSSSSSGRAVVETAAARVDPSAPGLAAVAIALSSNVSVARAQADATRELLAALPETEKVAVYVLASNPSNPILLTDARALRLGGARHALRRVDEVVDALRAAIRALEGTIVGGGEWAARTRALSPPLAGALARDVLAAAAAARDDSNDGDAAPLVENAWARGVTRVIKEMSRVDAHAEGAVSRNVVVIAPTRFRTALTVSDVSDVSADADADAAADAEDVLGLFHGGRWSLSWLTSTTERGVRVRAGPGMELEAAWDATGANALASQLLARRRRVYRVGACESSSNRAVSSLAATDDDDDDGASDDASSAARGKGGGGEGGACANAFAETTADADDEENENVVAVEARLGGGALGGVLRCAFPPPPFDATAHLATARCDAAAASLDEYPYPVGDSVTLRMTRAQRDVFDGGRAFLRGTWEEMLAAKSDMRLSVVLGGDPRGSDVSTYDWSNTRPGFDDVEPPLAPRPSGSSAAATPLRAKAKFRGVSSFRDCVRRKSLKVNVKGKTKLRLARGAASDRFLLISMCYDDRYLKTALVAGMAAELDVFPHAYGYVRLLVENPAGPGGGGAENGPDGGDVDAGGGKNKGNVSGGVVAASASSPRRWENEGLYLLVEDPTSALVGSFARPAAVVRRRNDAKRAADPIKGTPDVKFPEASKKLEGAHSRWNAENATRARYDEIAFVASSCLPGTCRDALDRRVDVEQYLRWMSLMTLVQSGDYVDEAWFYASETGDASSPLRFRVHAWDPDDSFQSCHHGGVNALRDPVGLLYCAEGDLDRALIRDPDVYSSFVDQLEWTLRVGMNASAVARIASAQLRDMFRVLSDDDTASGLLELLAANPAARDVAAAREDIEASAGWYVGLVETRRRTLLRRIAAYRREKDAAEKKKKNEGSGGDGARFAKTYATREIVASTPPPGCGAEEEEDDDEEKDAAAAPPPPPPPPTIRVTVNMAEYEYDAGGVQELVFHDLTLTNVGDDPIALGLGRRGDRVVVVDRDDPRVRTRVTVVRPTFTFGFDPSVTFTGGSYAAWPNEFRVGCWSSAHGGGDDAESVASADDAPRADFDVASNCTATAAVTGPSRRSTRAGGSEPPVAMQVYATFSNRSVSLTFGGAERGDGVDGAPVVLCPGCAVTLGKVSFYQRFWSAFQRGIATLNLKGVPDVRVRLGDRCGGGGGDDDDARATTPVAGGRTYPTRRG